MTPTYIALKPLRFGGQALVPGDPVPVEPGRDYAMMRRLGQIAEAPTAPPPSLSPFTAGQDLYFVAEDGAHTRVTFAQALPAPDEVREGLGLEAGALVAAVTFPEDPDNATFVPLASLLPEQPTGRLIKDLRGTQEPDGTFTPREGSIVVYVGEEGAPQLVTFLGMTGPEESGGAPGARVQAVGETETPEQHVPLADLLPGVPATRLLTHEQRRVSQSSEQGLDATETAMATAEAQKQALQGRVTFLELLVRAIRMEGEPLSGDLPHVKDVQANGILTREGLLLLAQGEHGKANLMALDRIAEKKAEALLASLFPSTAEPLAPDG